MNLTQFLHSNRVVFVLLLAIAFLVFANTLNNQFVWDDHYFIETSVHQTRFSFSALINGNYPVAGTGTFRPVRGLAYLFTRAVMGNHPTYYHLLAVFIHASIAFVLFLIANNLLHHRQASFLTALHFVLHPVHVEAIAWITASYDLLFVLFFSTSFYYYLIYKEHKQSSVLKLFYFFTLLSFLTNEMALILPLLILAYDWIFHHISIASNLKNRTFTPLYFSFVAYWLLRTLLIAPSPATSAVFSSLVQTGLLSLLLLGSYLSLLVLPVHLSVDHQLAPEITGLFFQNHHLDHQIPALSTNNPDILLSIAFLVICSLFLSKRIAPRFTFSLVWIIIALIPVLQFIPTPIIFAERYVYLASYGFALFLGALLASTSAKQLQAPTTALMVILCICYGYQTIHRNQDWQNDYTLWSKTLSQNPNSAASTNSLGTFYYQSGNYTQALDYYQQTFDLNPFSASYQKNMINLLTKLGKYDQLIEYYRFFLDRTPQDPELNFLVGQVYEDRLRDLVQAGEYYKQASKLMPRNQKYQKAIDRVTSSN